jgi:hypothetical protein
MRLYNIVLLFVKDFFFYNVAVEYWFLQLHFTCFSNVSYLYLLG